MSANFDAKALTRELDGRWNGRYGIARCIAPRHAGEDRHPSLHIADGRSGRRVLICRSQHCPDIIEGLKQRRLWSTPAPSSRVSRRPTIRELVAASPYVPPPACCLNQEVKCEHWREFDRQYLIAHLRGNLACAKREIINLFAAAREPLGVEQLFEELHAAVGFGAIAPPELPRSLIDRAIAEVALQE
jgi:hypothetical protein